MEKSSENKKLKKYFYTVIIVAVVGTGLFISFGTKIILYLSSAFAVTFLFISYFNSKKKVESRENTENNLRILAHAVKSLNECVIITDNQQRFIFVNDAFKKAYQYTGEDLINSDISILYSGKIDKQTLNNFLSQIVENDWSGELVHVKKDGTEFPVQMSVTSVKDDNGNPEALVSIINDITERKTSEEEIKRYIEELQINKDLLEQNAEEFLELNIKLYESEKQLTEINNNKDKFFSIISHDLRSPFNSLVGLSDILVNEMDSLTSEEIKDICLKINSSSRGTLNLVDNLLEWSRIQTGRIKFNPDTISLAKIVNETIGMIEGNAKKKEIELRNIIKEDVTVYADRNMISSVIGNLLSNAIKFTNEKGYILISTENSGDFITVTIKDNGTGITDENLERLFKIDSNISTLGTASEKGTGFGLILCKELVEKNKGKIWVESEVNKGTSFFFTIPKANNT